MDRVLDHNPAGFQQLGELANLVLGLGDRQAVARHDDDLAGIRQLDRHVVGRDLADGFA